MKTSELNLKGGGDGDAPSRFFKVILKDDRVQLPLQLGIPTKFVMKHGNDFSDLVCLRVPSGDTWEVKLWKKDGKVWLRDGWADFIKHYQISHGHILVFNYLGESWFDVVILDTTACEIQYPIKPDHRRRSHPADGPHFVTDSKEVIDLELRPHTYCRNKRKKKFAAHGLCPSKITKTVSQVRHAGGIPKHEFQSPKEELEGVKKESGGMFGGHLNSKCLKVKAQVARVAGGALSRAYSYHCKGPSIIIVLGCVSVYPNYLLYIPKIFQKTCNLKRRQSGDIRLWIHGGDTWTVGYCNNDKCFVSRGWKEFVMDNDLRFGDVCVFELIERTELMIRVVIFRGDGVSPTCQSSGCSRQPSGKASTGRSANERCSLRPVDSTVGEKCPSFEVVICKSAAVGNFLHVPNSFSRSHLKGARASNRATLKFMQRSWQIDLIDYGARSIRSYRMMGGWGKFTRDNYLRTGDVCIFKLVDKMHLVFEVSISKHTSKAIAVAVDGVSRD